MLKYIGLEDVTKEVGPNSCMAVLDASVLVDSFLKKEKRGREVVDSIKSGKSYPVTIIPDFIEYTTNSVVRGVTNWRSAMDGLYSRLRNSGTPSYRLSTLFSSIMRMQDKGLLDEYEKCLPPYMREATKSIPVNLEEPVNGMEDRALLYTAIEIRERATNPHVIVVTEDRGDIFTGPVYSGLNKVDFSLKTRGKAGKLQVMKSAEFLRHFRISGVV